MPNLPGIPKFYRLLREKLAKQNLKATKLEYDGKKIKIHIKKIEKHE